MRVAVLSESPADEVAISILVSGILGQAIEPVQHVPLRTRGWPSVLKVLPVVLSQLHYYTNAEACVVVVDSDDSPPHRPDHEDRDGEPKCRLCQLRFIAGQTLTKLSARAQGETLKVGLGLAVPSIEAWYQAGIDQRVNEAAWLRHLQRQAVGYDRLSLKRAVYATERPSIDLETSYATIAAQRLSADLNLLEQLFPHGFGSLMRDVRGW